MSEPWDIDPPDEVGKLRIENACCHEEIKRQADRIEQLEAEIKTAIRQFEDGNRLECHRTLCTAVYGKQH